MTRGVTLRDDFLWGIRPGLKVGAFLSVWGIVVYLVSGPRAFTQHGTTIQQVILGYFVGGIACGALAGLLRPRVRSRLSHMLIGVVVALPVYPVLRTTIDGLTKWDRWDYAGVFLFALIGGTIVGNIVFEYARRASTTRQ
jgi:hypothetical protein